MSSCYKRPESPLPAVFPLPLALSEPEAWDFLSDEELEPQPEPGDFWCEEVGDDFEDWLEEF